MKLRCPNIWLAVCEGPALFSFFSWEGRSLAVSLTLAHTRALTPLSKFAMSPPPIVLCSGSFCSHYLSPLMCMYKMVYWACEASGTGTAPSSFAVTHFQTMHWVAKGHAQPVALFKFPSSTRLCHGNKTRFCWLEVGKTEALGLSQFVLE